MRFPARVAVLAVASLLGSASASGAALTETKRIALSGVDGRIDHMAFDPATGRLFVAALGNNTVEVVDLAAGRVVKSIPDIGAPQGISVTSRNAVITEGARSRAAVVDLASLSIVRTIGTDPDPDNVRQDSDHARLYVGSGDKRGSLAIFDASSLVLLARIALPGHPESFQLERGGPRVFVNVPQVRAVVVVDRTTRQEIARWSLPASANFPMAWDEAHRRLFVGTRTPPRLLVVDGRSGAIVASPQLVGDADDLFYDEAAARLYAVGGEGHVQVIHQDDPDHYTATENVATRAGARTALFLPAQHCLVVALPKRSSSPAELRLFSTSSLPVTETSPCQ